MTSRLEIPVAEWRRVSPKYIVVDLVSTLLTAIVLVVGSAVPAYLSGVTWLWVFPIVLAAIFLPMLILTPRRVRAYGYQLRDDDLVYRKGLLFQRFVAIPYGRMQLIDITRGPVARAVGLSELKFVTAAAATNVTIPGLPAEEAESLRDHLVAVAESRRAGL